MKNSETEAARSLWEIEAEVLVEGSGVDRQRLQQSCSRLPTSTVGFFPHNGRRLGTPKRNGCACAQRRRRGTHGLARD